MTTAQPRAHNSANGHAPPGPDLTPLREAFRASLEQLQSETQRLESLRVARDQARERRWQLDQTLRQCEQAADEVEKSEPQRRAEVFTASGTITVKPTPELREAHAALAEAQAESNSIEAIMTTIDEEIEFAERGLGRLRSAVNEALGNLLAASPEFEALLQAQTRCWERLRGLRAAGELVLRACGGNLPIDLERRILNSEPLGVGHRIPGHVFETNMEPVTLWQSAIENLRQDPDAALPDVT